MMSQGFATLLQLFSVLTGKTTSINFQLVMLLGEDA